MYSEQKQIYWHSGLYLQPQHFQSLDLHHEWRFAQQLRIAQPFNVGLIDVSINDAALADFVVNVESIRLIMPGGTYLAFPGNCRVEKRNFREMWTQRDQPFNVWLGLRRFDPQHSNVTTLEKEQERSVTRWVSTDDNDVMKDVYDHAPDASVSRIGYNVRLLSDSEKEEAVDCECIPLVRLRYENDSVIIDPLFSPPCVTLYAFPALGHLIDSIYFDISARAKKLEEYKRSERLVSKSEGSEQVTQLLAMRSLNRVLPLLRNQCQARQIHPWQVYNLLCQLIGELSSFNDGCSFLGEWREGEAPLKTYDHYQLVESFESARSTLNALLNGLVLEDNTYIKLEKDFSGVFSGYFDSTQSQKADSILLLLRSSVIAMENQQIKNIGGIKLASPKIIEALIQHALPGISMKYCPQPPRGVPNRSGSHYFSVDRDSELWNKAELHKSIALYWPEMPDDLQAQIIFVVQS